MSGIQHIVPLVPPVTTVPVRQISAHLPSDIDRLQTASYLGVAVAHNNGTLTRIIFATVEEIFLLKLDKTKLSLCRRFQDLLDGSATLVGFEMAKFGLMLQAYFKTPVQGVDLSVCSNKSKKPSDFVAEKGIPLGHGQAFKINKLWHNNSSEENACHRAWISARVALAFLSEIHIAGRVNTRHLEPKILSCLHRLVVQIDILHAAKPKTVAGEFDAVDVTADGHVKVRNARYKTRIRSSNQTTILMKDQNGNKVFGKSDSVKGKTTTITTFDSKTLRGELSSIHVLGIEEPTVAERARDELLLHTTTGKHDLLQSDFIRYLWFPSEEDKRTLATIYPPLVQERNPKLNTSQQQVVLAMTSDRPLTIVHGPPGTGKTTTIAAASSLWDKSRQPTWIVAHSNVAVKNIAEKLFKENINFMIIVSKEFHFEWHEHLYETIETRLIRTDELPKDIVAMERALNGSHIILSTLSTLSNPALDQNRTFDLVPVQGLIVDEASQINVFDYLAVFFKFRKTLKKVYFFGDPKQLPPFGQDTVPSLQCVFDIQHLNEKSYFLNVQYRMPVPLGKFISRSVYGGRLVSSHRIQTSTSVVFVDVTKGCETKMQTSWVNEEEVNMLVHLVRSYYRYMDFCILTPYDAQRAAIQAALKAEKDLPWEEVYNVDSFQGNEREYVLVSPVRSDKPGFLRSEQRMNVMMTRCKAGMVIVSSRVFLENNGKNTLLGKMVQHWANQYGRDKTWVDWRAVIEGKVNLPGAPGKHAPTQVAHSLPPSDASLSLAQTFSRLAISNFPSLPVEDAELPQVRGKWRRGRPGSQRVL